MAEIPGQPVSSEFSPLTLGYLIKEPLKYFFAHYAGDDLVYSDDDYNTKIVIRSVNDFNQTLTQEKPRILIDRGNYQVNKTGITNNAYQISRMKDFHGDSHVENMVFVEGNASVIIEARQEGVCELITDMVTHFLVWTRPFLCANFGFTEFALPLQVSSPQPNKQDTEFFRVQVSVPWRKEERWSVKEEALRLNGFFFDLQNGNTS